MKSGKVQSGKNILKTKSEGGDFLNVAGLINGDEMRERLQKLLQETARTNGEGERLELENKIEGDGQLSHSGSFKGDH